MGETCLSIHAESWVLVLRPYDSLERIRGMDQRFRSKEILFKIIRFYGGVVLVPLKNCEVFVKYQFIHFIKGVFSQKDLVTNDDLSKSYLSLPENKDIS